MDSYVTYMRMLTLLLDNTVAAIKTDAEPEVQPRFLILMHERVALTSSSVSMLMNGHAGPSDWLDEAAESLRYDEMLLRALR